MSFIDFIENLNLTKFFDKKNYSEYDLAKALYILFIENSFVFKHYYTIIKIYHKWFKIIYNKTIDLVILDLSIKIIIYFFIKNK